MLDPKIQLEFLLPSSTLVEKNISYINHMAYRKNHNQYKQYVGAIYESYCLYVLLVNGYRALLWRDYAKMRAISVCDIGIDIVCWHAADGYDANYEIPVQCKFRSSTVGLNEIDHFYMNIQRYYGSTRQSMFLTNVKISPNWSFDQMQLISLSGPISGYKEWLYSMGVPTRSLDDPTITVPRTCRVLDIRRKYNWIHYTILSSISAIVPNLRGAVYRYAAKIWYKLIHM